MPVYPKYFLCCKGVMGMKQGPGHPRVLLIGNGLNKAFTDAKLLKEILCDMTSNKNITEDMELKMPFPLEVVLRTNDNVNNRLIGISRQMYGRVDDSYRRVIRKILSMGFDEIITTNYSYEIEIGASDGEDITDYELKKMQRHTKAVNKAESMYLLHTYNEVEYNGYKNRVWHIHGESRKPSSMIVGHYYYGTILYKYRQFLSGRKYYDFNKPDYEMKSWIDSFILGDVYILGFKFDLAEMDLWWLLNRKKNEKVRGGRVYFYEPKKLVDGKIFKIFDERIELMKLYKTEHSDLGCAIEQTDNTENIERKFRRFYTEAIDDIDRKMRGR